MDIMHIDANSAYLSWTAAALLEKGYKIDIRDIPAVISGNPDKRHGIILAKSIPAKKYGIKTGQSLLEAKKQCPELQVFPPNYDLYLSCSNAMYDILAEYSSIIERYSIDECFIDYTNSRKRYGAPEKIAHEIKDRIKNELGFTVNVGVSSNKVLAKMAGELKKPDMVHTLYPDEIEKKMWGLPVEELFMVGRATTRKLHDIGIYTIGQLAKAEPIHIRAILKSHGQLVWEYANGIDRSPVIQNEEIPQKSIGNSTTVDHDVIDIREAKMILYALTERVCMRLRRQKLRSNVVGVHIKSNEFITTNHQSKRSVFYQSTSEIYSIAAELLEDIWKGQPARQIGVWVSNLTKDGELQLNFLEGKKMLEQEELEKTIDKIREHYGEKAIFRGCFANMPIEPIQGGVNKGDYVMMGGVHYEDIGESY